MTIDFSCELYFTESVFGQQTEHVLVNRRLHVHSRSLAKVAAAETAPSTEAAVLAAATVKTN